VGGGRNGVFLGICHYWSADVRVETGERAQGEEKAMMTEMKLHLGGRRSL
jgi:hypothetical protein